MARRTQGASSAAYMPEVDPRFKVTPLSPPNKQTFEEFKEVVIQILKYGGNKPTRFNAGEVNSVLKAHQQAVTAAEVMLLEKLKHGAGFIANSPRLVTAEGYYAVPIEDIDAELTKRGAR